MSRQPAVPFVEIVCSKKGESALVRVKDNGGGIPSELMDKIFDPYFTTKFKSQG
jgi:C4-dicarboxylate-specific signal transduction histidine kinase